MKDIITLGIETSCDETAAAVVKNGRTVLSNIIYSQAEHIAFGGVVPELAGRAHITMIDKIVAEALRAAAVSPAQLSAVAVASGAGLAGALLVGVSFAKGLAYNYNLPLVEVNHIQSHIAANYIDTDLRPPFLSLVVSGGHTAVVLVSDYTKFEVIASTIDDAVGEAFDKIGRYMGLEYPSGAKIDAMARKGEACIRFTKYRPNKTADFISYSGLKTAVINYINTEKQRGTSRVTAAEGGSDSLNIPDICASFTRAALDPLIEKTISAALRHNQKTIALAGGVAANSYLRQNLTAKGHEAGITVLCPPLVLCTDNAAMTAAQGYFNFIGKKGIADLYLNAKPSMKITE